ncbi:MAG: DUF3352 domain-containing protein [Saprospiraceae bacterium]
MSTILKHPQFRLVLASLLIAGCLVWLFLTPENPGPYRSIPAQTSILLNFNGVLNAAKMTQQIDDGNWKATLKHPIFENCWKEIGYVETLFHENNQMRKAFMHNTLLAGYTLNPSDSLHPLFVLDIGDGFSLKGFLTGSPAPLKVFPYQFHSQTLFSVTLKDGQYIVVAQKGHSLIFSRYSYLVEDALSQAEEPRGWWSSSAFLDDLDEGAPMRLFFRPSAWQAQHLGGLKEESRNIPGVFSRNIEWLGLAVNGGSVKAMCKTIGFLSETGAWNGVKASNFESVMPDNTAIVLWAGFDNQNKFYEHLSDKTKGDFERFMLPWAGNEAFMAVTEPLSSGLREDLFLFLSVTDPESAVRALASYGETRGLVEKLKIGMFEVYGFKQNSILAPFFEQSDNKFLNPYCTLLNNYLVVAPNLASLEVLLEKYIANQTLAQNTDFLQARSKLATTNRGIIMLQSAYLTRIVDQLFTSEYKILAEQNAAFISKSGWLTCELDPRTELKMKLSLKSQQNTQPAPNSNIFWRNSLETRARSAVFCVPQPGLPYKEVLLIQDVQGKLYCFSTNGRLLWKKFIGDPILSEITGIDYFQNGRNCYIFNTTSQVWIIDDNGQEVNAYPLALKTPCSQGLCLTDVYNKLGFNYFISSDNGRIYGFDKLGRALDGWNPQIDCGDPAGSLLHFRQKEKDYLIQLSKDGLLSVFGKDGKPKFTADTLEGVFDIKPIIDLSGSRPRILCISRAGVLYGIELNGKMQILDKPEVVADPPLAMLPIGKGKSQLIGIFHKRRLNLYSLSKSNIQKSGVYQFAQDQSEAFLSEYGIGSLSESTRKVRLLDDQNQIMEKLILAGTTPFASFSIADKHMIAVGLERTITSYSID